MLLAIVNYFIGLIQAVTLLAIIMFSRFHQKDKNASTVIYFLFTIISFCHFPAVQGHGNGAPKSRCDTMIPGHWVNAQTGLSPYQILVDKTVVRPGDRVNLTLTTISGQIGFKGFFVMVKEAPGDDDEEVDASPASKNYGVFDLASSDMHHAQPVHCFDQRNSAMTHVVNYVKETVQLFWIAPKLMTEDEEASAHSVKHGKPYMEKELRIVATFVKDFWTFWSDVEPVGDVRLLLTDTYQPSSERPVSPKFSSPVPSPSVGTPGGHFVPLPTSPSSFVPVNNRQGSVTSKGHSVPTEGDSSWSHLKRAWNMMVNFFGSGGSS